MKIGSHAGVSFLQPLPSDFHTDFNNRTADQEYTMSTQGSPRYGGKFDEWCRSGINWHTVQTCLDEGNYERLAAELRRAQTVLDPEYNDLLLPLLGALYQLCRACSRIAAETEWHQRAQQESAHQTAELHQAIESILRILQGTASEEEQSILAANGPVSSTGVGARLQQILHWLVGQAPETKPDGHAFREQAPPDEDAPPKAEPIEAEIDDIPYLRVYALGHFLVYENDYLIVDWPSRRGKSIFKYLILHRQQRIPKEVLMETFWPNADPEAARNNLNVSIYGLRQVLRNKHPEYSHIVFEDGQYLLNPEMQVWVDVEAFLIHFRAGYQYEQQHQYDLACQEYAQAEALYRGELFEEDRYESWMATSRQTLQDHYLALMTALCRYYYEQGNYPASITVCSKILDIDPCQEAAHRHMMRCYSRTGQRNLVLRQYHLCETALREELDINPGAETVDLYRQICRGNAI